MTKQEFLDSLRAGLEARAIQNIDSMIEYYDEMIADRMEDGMSEEEAVASIESVDAIVTQAVLDKPVSALVKEKVRKSREKAEKSGVGWVWILLAILGFPIWFPLGLTALILAFTFALVFWILVLVLFIVFFAIGISGVACFLGGFAIFMGFIPLATSLVSFGGGLVLIALCILLWKPLTAFAKAAGRAFASMILSIKKLFVK